MKEVCSYCGKESIHAKGLCEACYAQQRRYRTLIGYKKRPINKKLSCSLCTSKKPVHAKGLCKVCYENQLRKGYSKNNSIVNKTTSCSYCGEKPVCAKGLCLICYIKQYYAAN